MSCGVVIISCGVFIFAFTNIALVGLGQFMTYCTTALSRWKTKLILPSSHGKINAIATL